MKVDFPGLTNWVPNEAYLTQQTEPLDKSDTVKDEYLYSTRAGSQLAERLESKEECSALTKQRPF